jgi:aspartate carbamoyltransferase catalytic subunit
MHELDNPTLEGLRITLVGNLRHNPCIHSLARLLLLFPSVQRITYVAPYDATMPRSLVGDVSAVGVEQNEVETLSDEVLANTDVLYIIPLQERRGSHAFHAVLSLILSVVCLYRWSADCLRRRKAYMPTRRTT